jgi:hypothetical protein
MIFYSRWYTYIFVAFLLIFSACRSQAPVGDQAGEGDSKKKQKLKRCPLPSCHVRMDHAHADADVSGMFKGKRGCFIRRIFTPKNPKYGQGLPRNKRVKPYK